MYTEENLSLILPRYRSDLFNEQSQTHHRFFRIHFLYKRTGAEDKIRDSKIDFPKLVLLNSK